MADDPMAKRAVQTLRCLVRSLSVAVARNLSHSTLDVLHLTAKTIEGTTVKTNVEMNVETTRPRNVGALNGLLLNVPRPVDRSRRETGMRTDVSPLVVVREKHLAAVDLMTMETNTLMTFMTCTNLAEAEEPMAGDLAARSLAQLTLTRKRKMTTMEVMLMTPTSRWSPDQRLGDDHPPAPPPLLVVVVPAARSGSRSTLATHATSSSHQARLCASSFSPSARSLVFARTSRLKSRMMVI